jgi:SAM-dependent methyltransferase
MNGSQVMRRLSVVLCAALVTAAAPAQTPQTKEPFKLEVYQPGKDVVWVPTPQALVDKMLDLAKVTSEDYLIDLGSGDGRTVIAAAKRGTRALGIEYNPDMVELSKENAAKAGVTDRVAFLKADLFESDLSQGTVITMFLLTEINLKLRPRLLDLKAGTRVVSNTFKMGDWTPDGTAAVNGGCEAWCTAYLWIVPAQVEGTWRVLEGELALKQSFQTISGTLTANGRSVPISAGRLHANRISFSAGGATYTGEVSGEAMEGTVTSGARKRPWGATRDRR